MAENDPNIQAQATQLMGQVPFGAIIAAPLTAAVSAQAAAAQACVDFVTKVGLDDKGNVQTTKFRFSKSSLPSPEAVAKVRANLNPPAETGKELSADQQKQFDDLIKKELPTGGTVEIEVPKLCLMPIPFIRIDNMTIAMKMSVTATTETATKDEKSTAVEGKADGSIGWGPVKVGFSGSISSKKDSTATSTSKYSVEQTIDINIHATQDDMPAGLAKVLNLLGENIRTISQG
jgi:hypothetical protein